MDGADVKYAKVFSKQYSYISRANVRNLDKIIVVDDDSGIL
jgi:hypothetical protein